MRVYYYFYILKPLCIISDVFYVKRNPGVRYEFD
jgi:hypothetical protein